MRTSAGAGTSYALTGDNVVATFPSDNRVFAGFAGFAGYDPFTSTQSGLSNPGSVLLYFGAPGVPGVNGYAHSTHVNNQIYAATEDPNDQAQITVTSPSGATTTTNLPTYASGSTLYPRLAMVTSGTVPNNSWMPAGVTPCSCQYLQWGYWTGQAGIPNAAGTNYSRLDVAAINTWIAGTPTPVTDINTLVTQRATEPITAPRSAPSSTMARPIWPRAASTKAIISGRKRARSTSRTSTRCRGTRPRFPALAPAPFLRAPRPA